MVSFGKSERLGSLLRKTVLIVDDDEDCRELLQDSLRSEPFDVIAATNGQEALRMVDEFGPDLVILDVSMPGLSGLEVCRKLRSDKSHGQIPIVFLSGRDLAFDRITGLELGADDYVTKPFEFRELALRIKNILRRLLGVPNANPVLVAGDLSMDTECHQVFIGGTEIHLTLTEFKLLAALVKGGGRVKTREDLLETIWENGEGLYSRTVDTHIQRLRSKLKHCGQGIETIRGIGYRYNS